jgi:hypothetical protein
MDRTYDFHYCSIWKTAEIREGWDTENISGVDKMMSDLITWLGLIFGEGQVWLTGAIIIVFYILGRSERRTVPTTPYLLIFFILSILSASFFVWQDENQKVIALEQYIVTEKDRNKQNLHGGTDTSDVSPAGTSNTH